MHAIRVHVRIGLLLALSATFLVLPSRAQALERLCDSSFETTCRTEVLTRIQNENVAIEVGAWFFEDARFVNELIKRKQAGVPIRLLADPDSDKQHPLNNQLLNQMASAGIPIRYKFTSGIEHWKLMLFAGQNVVYFGSANFSDDAFVPNDPYKDYVDETIYLTDDPDIVNSFKTKYDDAWMDTANYANYANAPNSSVFRRYPTYPLDPEMNWAPATGSASYRSRMVKAIDAETTRIDVIMYRITDQAHVDALIRAKQRGVPIRFYTEQAMYREPTQPWHSFSVDRLYAAGIPLKDRAHLGQNHEKLAIFYGQALTVFGSSNMTSKSSDSQHEHNYFTKKTAILTWFKDQFTRKWNNSNPLKAAETKAFVPLPPDTPVNKSPANGATGVPTSGSKLTWYGGMWAHVYDVYFGTSSNPPLYLANQALGPSLTTSTNQSITLPALTVGTTYYWKIVSKTMANQTSTGAIWSFTTKSGTTAPPPSPDTIVLYGADVQAAKIHGSWAVGNDTGAGDKSIWNPDQGHAKIAPALASPANYFEMTFTADARRAYHLWIRMRAQGNSLGNDSVHVQFSDSATSSGAATMRIGSTSSAEVVLQDGPSGASPSSWGWTDNGWGSLGGHIYFTGGTTHTIRIQQREDGAIIDQIVLSPDTYLTSAPGARRNDSTILPRNP